MNINGELRVPGDKSIWHRAFMLGALARGTTVVSRDLESHDVASTRGVLKALGAAIEKRGDTWVVTGGNLQEPSAVLDAGNSGTTARLMSGILSGIGGVMARSRNTRAKAAISSGVSPLQARAVRNSALTGGVMASSTSDMAAART